MSEPPRIRGQSLKEEIGRVLPKVLVATNQSSYLISLCMGELHGPHVAGPENYSGYQGRHLVILKGEKFVCFSCFLL